MGPNFKKILECDIFLFALAPEALSSHACKLELNYANDLGKTILPVLMSDGVSVNFLPPALSTIQYVDFRDQNKQAVFDFIKAINNLPSPQQLPDPLPIPPEVPISYLGNLKDQVETKRTLSFEDQSALLLKLEESLLKTDDSNDVRNLLELLKNRDDLFAKIAEKIDGLLNSIEITSIPETGRQRTDIQSAPNDIAVVDPSSSNNFKDAIAIFGQRRVITYRGHRIEMKLGFMNKMVFYDGRGVSRISLGSRDPANFTVVEDGTEVQYEVLMEEKLLKYDCEVKRNGRIIYTGAIIHL